MLFSLYFLNFESFYMKMYKPLKGSIISVIFLPTPDSIAPLKMDEVRTTILNLSP